MAASSTSVLSILNCLEQTQLNNALNNMHRDFYSTILLSLVASAGVVMPAYAQLYPSQPIQLVSPFAPGSTDAMLRPFVERLPEFLGQPVVLNYKSGAGGAVGASFVAASKPDGYTLVGTSIGSIVLGPLANKDSKFSLDSFTPIAAVAEGSLILVVPSSSKFKTLKDMVEYSKQHPRQLTYTSSGAMGITHVLTEIAAKEAGVSWTHIAYQGSGPGVTALLGGHVDMASSAVGPVQAHIKAGTLRPLAVYSEARMKAYPDVPTLKELGYNVASPVVYGLLAPKGTPREVVDTLYSALKKVTAKYADPIATNLAVSGAELRLMSPEEYMAHLRAQQKLYSEAVKQLSLVK
jgi:tripartite-type tricarboxylate transporter receptor subunit TctC